MTTAPIFNFTDTWNDAGVTYSAIKVSITDTASAAGSKLIDFEVGGVSQASIGKDGGITCKGLTSSLNIDLQGNRLVMDADNDTYLEASTDDRLDFVVGGTLVARFDANAVDTFQLDGVGFSPTGAVVGQALGYPNSTTTLEPYTPAGGGDLLAAANETVTGDYNFTGALQWNGVQVVSLSATQTLTNKSLTSPTVGGSPDFSAATISKASREAFAVYDTAVENYTGLKALTAGDYRIVHVGDANRGGLFAWRSGDRSSSVTGDASEGVWVPPSSDVTGASGAWQRIFNGPAQAKWFNALPGAGNVQTELQNAANWCVANGYPLYITSGTYRVDSSVQIINSDAEIFGDGRETIILNGSTNTPIFEIGDNTSVYFRINVRNLTFAGVSGVTAVDGSCGIRMSKVQQCRVDNVTVTSFGGFYAPLFDGIVIRGNSQVIQMNWSAMNDVLNDGVQITGESLGIWINQFQNIACGRDGFHIHESEAIHAVDCESFNSGRYGWNMTGTNFPAGKMKNCTLVGCVGDTSGNHNWNITHLRNSRFINCWASFHSGTAPAGSNGFNFDGAAAGQIRNVTFTGAFSIGRNNHAYYFNNAQDISITGNHARGSDNDAVEGKTFTLGDGFRLRNCDHVTVVSNSAESCTQTGFNIDNTNASVAFIGNVARNCATDYSVSTSITDGKIYGNPGLEEDPIFGSVTADNVTMADNGFRHNTNGTFQHRSDTTFHTRLYNESNTNGSTVGMLWGLQNASNAITDYGRIYVGIGDNTAGAEDGYMSIILRQNGSDVEVGRIIGDTRRWAINKNSASYTLDVAGDVNVDSTQAYRVNGTVAINGVGTAITSLTNSTGGTTDGTLEAVSGSGADAAINNNFAELNAKLDAILATMRDKKPSIAT